jgi:transposase
MLGFRSATRVYVAIGATGIRKGFEGLFGIVRDRLMIDPLSGHLFVFCNSRKHLAKTFDVNPVVARISLNEMFPASKQNDL